jgi:hypothetical protein
MTSTAPTNPMTTSAAQKPRSPPAECEATAICEGYSFDVFLAPTDVPRLNPRQLSGPLIDTIRCCLEPLIASLPKPPEPFGSFSGKAAAWSLWCCRVKQALIGFFSTGPQANCTLVQQLSSFACPAANAQNFDAEMQQALRVLEVLLLEAMLACLCSALLPPAPCGTSDDRVPLAIVTVRKKDCKVLRVCNWTSLRKLVITFPTLEYWLSWIPWFKSIQDAIARFCCVDFRLPERDPANTDVAGVNAAGTTTGADATYLMVNPALENQHITDNQTMTTLIMNAFARGNTPLDPLALLNGAFGFTAEARQPLTETEKANLGPFLLLNQVMRPVVSSLVPDGLVGDRPLGVADTVMNGGDQQASLYKRVEILEKAVAKMRKD